MRHFNDDYYQTWAQIDLKALDYNLKKIRSVVSDKVKVLATVKANAYGHGIIKVSKFLENRVDFLGVASVEEALKLKREGIKRDILILGNTLPEGLPKIVDYDLIATITCENAALILDNLAKKKNKFARVHIKIDTGMGRIGFWHDAAFEAVKKINELKHVRIEGLFTHLSSAECDKDFTLEQLKRFNKLIEKIENRGIKIPLYHAANSMATVHYKESHFNLVRPGLILYGVRPDFDSKKVLDIRSVLSLKTKIIYLKDVESDRSISYGRTYITNKRTKVATLPVGYADGYTHLLTHKAKVLIKGKCAPVIGKICMDQIMVDVSNIEDVKIGDEVTLIGSDGDNKIIIERLARLVGTIPYEVLCWISERVKRIYTGF